MPRDRTGGDLRVDLGVKRIFENGTSATLWADDGQHDDSLGQIALRITAIFVAAGMLLACVISICRSVLPSKSAASSENMTLRDAQQAAAEEGERLKDDDDDDGDDGELPVFYHVSKRSSAVVREVPIPIAEVDSIAGLRKKVLARATQLAARKLSPKEVQLEYLVPKTGTSVPITSSTPVEDVLESDGCVLRLKPLR